MTRRIYRTPPIVEAFCMVRFAPAPMDLFTPGVLFERLRGSYPQQPKSVAPRPPQGVVGALPAGGQINLVVAPPRFDQVIFSSEDETRRLVLTENELGVHSLKPYAGWESLRAWFDEALKTYEHARGTRPVILLAVRYLNLIELDGAEPDLARYLNNAPRSVEGLPRDLGLQHRTEYVCGNNTRLIVNLVSLEPPAGKTHLLLDLDVARSWSTPAAMSADEMLAELDRLHTVEGGAFESLITDDLREIFDA